MRTRGASSLSPAALVLLGVALVSPRALADTAPRYADHADGAGFVGMLLELGLPEEAGREAHRLILLRGAEALPADTSFRVGMALALAGDAERAVAFLRLAASATPDPATADRWQLATGVALLRAHLFPHAFHLFARVEAFGVDEPTRIRAARLGCIGSVLAHDSAAARSCVQRLAHVPASPRRERLLAALEINPQRRAIVGGVLSGVLPGLGQLTASHPGDAALALVVNGAAGAALYLLIADGAIFDAALLGLGVSLRYYLGNINNGANAWRAAALGQRESAARELILDLGAESP